MHTITYKKTGSYISYSVDSDTKEVIIENIKSHKKGEGSKLAKRVINLYNRRYAHRGYSLTLYAYPTDGTIEQDNLVSFWERQGFEADKGQGGEGVFMTY